MIITGKKFSKPAMSRVINGDTELPDTPDAPDKYRLDHLLVEQHPEYNRSTLQRFIKQGYVTVDGAPATKPNAKFENTATIVLNPPKTTQTLPKLPIIYEDDHVKVVNKPTGLLSMTKGEYCPEPTLEDYGLLVHRLDRDTSGVVILAKDQATQKLLRKQFQDRKTHKTYYAVVQGHPKQSEALIDLPIERNFKRPNTFLVTPNGKPSQTYYKVIDQNDQYSLLELKPTTGRTHQLRVHLNYLGTPILGDRVYGHGEMQKMSSEGHPQLLRGRSDEARKDGPEERPEEDIFVSRLFLHAYQLEITIPPSDRRTFTAPLPPEFTDVFR